MSEFDPVVISIGRGQGLEPLVIIVLEIGGGAAPSSSFVLIVIFKIFLLSLKV